MWRKPKGILPPTAIREFKGINKQDAFSIAEGEATSLKNLTSSAYPALTVRPGFTNLGSSFGGAIVGLGAWKDTELHAVGNGSWKKWTGSAWSTALATSLSTTAQWSFCNFKGDFTDINLLGVNGASASKYDGTNVSALTDCPAGANYIDTHDNRVYVAVGQSVFGSGLRKAEDWDTSDTESVGAVEIVVETPDGRSISAMKAGPGHLVVFKPRSMFELYGTGKNNFRLIPVSDKIGCDVNQSAIMIGGILYFKGTDGIYQYAGGVLPKKDFSLPVQWYIDNINAANTSKACAGTDGKRLYMALPVSAATNPSHVLEYDPQFGTWCVWELGHYPRSFAFMNGSWYEGDSAGQVHQMGGAADAGTAIAWDWVSKPFGSGTLAQKHEWYDMWIVCDLPTGSTMKVYLSKLAEGDSDWTEVKTLTVNDNIQSAKTIIPVGTVANANWIRVKLAGTGPCSIYEVTRKERILPYV